MTGVEGAGQCCRSGKEEFESEEGNVHFHQKILPSIIDGWRRAIV